jgi:hypothetical protein
MRERDAAADATVLDSAAPDDAQTDSTVAPLPDAQIDDRSSAPDVVDARAPGSDAAADSAATCPAGMTPCNGQCIDPTRDPANCGACGTRCVAPANATTSCVAGSCENTCAPSFGNCDGAWGNGCETALGTATHCARCGDRCAAPTPSCDAIAGRCISSCPAGQTLCGTSCVDLGSSPTHCGACNNACSAPANSTAVCAARTCSSVCRAGFGDCDANAANGCEVDLSRTVAHCGRCGQACAPRANSIVACSAGGCVYSCNAGFGDCDGNAANGCESALDGNPAHCGRCGLSCGANGACTRGLGGPTCVGCAQNTCGSYCANWAADVRDCGGCGYRCAAAPTGYTATCNAGRCKYGAACDAHRGDCDRDPANGYETDLNGSNAHCGACGTVCGFGQRCCNGVCRLTSQTCFPCA